MKNLTTTNLVLYVTSLAAKKTASKEAKQRADLFLPLLQGVETTEQALKAFAQWDAARLESELPSSATLEEKRKELEAEREKEIKKEQRDAKRKSESILPLFQDLYPLLSKEGVGKQLAEVLLKELVDAFPGIENHRGFRFFEVGKGNSSAMRQKWVKEAKWFAVDIAVKAKDSEDGDDGEELEELAKD